MDIQRTSAARSRKIRRVGYVSLSLGLLAAITLGLSKLKPAAPTVEKSAIWTDTVQRGSMLREVRGTGALVPVEIRWIPVMNPGRVERILVLPGAAVSADTPLVVCSNPELEQAAVDAELSCKAAEAELENLQVQLESTRLNQKAAAASLNCDHKLAELEAQADEELGKAGLVPSLMVKRSRSKADELKERCDIEQKKLEMSADATRAQLAVQKAKLEQLKAQARLKRQQVESLTIRAGIDGVLQKLGDKDQLQIGQQLSPGANVARVADPLRLKAEIRIPETQARDILLGQKATVDTRNGIAEGTVQRIDPAVQNGTVTVDVSLQGTLPRGCRPDLTVEGTIQIERLEDVLNVGRPVQAQPDSIVSMFKVVNGGREAVKARVKLGRTSVDRIEIREGLNAGDAIILSDMSKWDACERVRLK